MEKVKLMLADDKMKEIDDKCIAVASTPAGSTAIIRDEEGTTEIEIDEKVTKLFGMVVFLGSMCEALKQTKSKTKEIYPQTYKTYSLLPLNLSDYTTEQVYIDSGDEEDRLISEKYRNTNNVLIRKEVTTYLGPNKSKEEEPIYYLIDLETFNEIPKYVDGELYYRFENIKDKQVKYAKNFNFIRFYTKPYFFHLSSDHRKWERKITTQPLSSHQKEIRVAHDIRIGKKIFDHMVPVSFEELFSLNEHM